MTTRTTTKTTTVTSTATTTSSTTTSNLLPFWSYVSNHVLSLHFSYHDRYDYAYKHRQEGSDHFACQCFLANCVSPYALAPSGSCVNTLIDFNNCGAVGHNCSSNYTSCSAGKCSTAPGIQLANPNVVWTAGLNGSADDELYSVTLPFSVTLYNTTASVISVTTNGVSSSLCLLDRSRERSVVTSQSNARHQ